MSTWEKYYLNILKQGLFNEVGSRSISTLYKILVKKILNHNFVSLELGCGIARFTLTIVDNSRYAIGVDLHVPDRILKNIFKQKAVKTDFIVADVRHLPFRSEVFDFVHSQGLYEHFKDKERDLVIKESIRVLKKGGILFFTVPNALNILYRVGKFISELKRSWIYGWEKPLTIKDVLLYLKRYNAKVLIYGGIGFLGQFFDIPSVRRILAGLGINYKRIIGLHFYRNFGFGAFSSLLGKQIFVIAKKTKGLT